MAVTPRIGNKPDWHWIGELGNTIYTDINRIISCHFYFQIFHHSDLSGFHLSLRILVLAVSVSNPQTYLGLAQKFRSSLQSQKELHDFLLDTIIKPSPRVFQKNPYCCQSQLGGCPKCGNFPNLNFCKILGNSPTFDSYQMC